MNKFAILINPTKTHNYNKVKQLLISIKNKYTFYSIHEKETEFFPKISKTSEIEALLVFGGDGTVLHSAKYAIKYGVPIFGVNIGSLGFLTETKLFELLKALEKLKKDRFTIQSRILLNVSVIRNKKKLFSANALNDVVIFRGFTAKMITINFYVNRLFVFTTKSDGMIITTPTGSTGYSLSAGGPLLSPTMEAFVVTPLHPHTLTARPMVFSYEDQFSFKIKGAHKDSVLQVDGENLFSLDEDDLINIKRANVKIGFVKLLNRTYYQILREKLHLGRR